MSEWTQEKERHLDQAITLLKSQKKQVFTPACENVIEAAKAWMMLLNRMPDSTKYNHPVHGTFMPMNFYAALDDAFEDAFTQYNTWLEENFDFKESCEKEEREKP